MDAATLREIQPVGFRSIRLIFDLDSTASADELDKLIATTERYCVVFETLASSPALAVERRAIA